MNFRKIQTCCFTFQPLFETNLSKTRKIVIVLTEDKNSWERTLVYQTYHENLIVVVQQKRYNDKRWKECTHSIARSRKYLLASWPSYPKNQQQTHTEAQFLLLEVLFLHLKSRIISHHTIFLMYLRTWKKIFNKYDCDMVPILWKSTRCSISLRQLGWCLGSSTITWITFSANSMCNTVERS